VCIHSIQRDLVVNRFSLFVKYYVTSSFSCQTFSSDVSHSFPVCVLKGPPFVFSNEVCLCSSLRVGLSSNNSSYKYSNLFVDQWRSWDDGQLTVQFVISPIRNRSAYLDAILDRLRRKRKVTRRSRCELLLRYNNSACDVYIYIY